MIENNDPELGLSVMDSFKNYIKDMQLNTSKNIDDEFVDMHTREIWTAYMNGYQDAMQRFVGKLLEGMKLAVQQNKQKASHEQNKSVN